MPIFHLLLINHANLLFLHQQYNNQSHLNIVLIENFPFFNFPDDIPIQSTEEANQQMASITEENEADLQIGSRNVLIRSSKEILKTHKVPFPGFKKKDKDKDKDRDKDKDKDKETKDNSSGGKSPAIKNGNIFSDNKESPVITAINKPFMKKEKRASLQTSSVDATDFNLVDKTSPTANIKRKSSSIDVVNTITADIMQLQSFANGSVIIEEKSDADGNGIVDAMNTESNNVSQRSSIIVDHNAKVLNNTQISQV